jgi:N-acetylglutamate synthase-like GNAT family acetyltransferase
MAGPGDPAGDGLRISTDPADVDPDWLHAALSQRAYWALGRSRQTVERSLEHSLCWSMLDGPRQVGFARVITDQATFAWICDVFVDEAWRGRGIGRRLMTAIIADPRLQGLKRMVLATDTAASFYTLYGFRTIDDPGHWMLRSGALPQDADG